MRTDDLTGARLALADLSAAYAFAVDERDGSAFAAVFTADGRLEVHRPGDGGVPSSVSVGHLELAGVPAGLAARYGATRHVVGQARHTVDGDRATGLVYCTAHHLEPGPSGASDVARLVTYDDTYERTPSGWRIAVRRVCVDWTTRVPVEEVGIVAWPGPTSLEEAR